MENATSKKNFLVTKVLYKVITMLKGGEGDLSALTFTTKLNAGLSIN